MIAFESGSDWGEIHFGRFSAVRFAFPLLLGWEASLHTLALASLVDRQPPLPPSFRTRFYEDYQYALLAAISNLRIALVRKNGFVRFCRRNVNKSQKVLDPQRPNRLI